MADKRDYAHWCVQLMDGDTYFMEDLYKALEEDGFVDENHEWIYEEEE